MRILNLLRLEEILITPNLWFWDEGALRLHRHYFFNTYGIEQCNRTVAAFTLARLRGLFRYWGSVVVVGTNAWQLSLDVL